MRRSIEILRALGVAGYIEEIYQLRGFVEMIQYLFYIVGSVCLLIGSIIGACKL